LRIVHISNFYSPRSGGIKTTMHELGSRYQKFGHEFFYVIPGIRFAVDTTAYGTQISLPSLPIPFTGGYRVIRSNRSIKRILMTLRPNRIEVSDRLTLRSIGSWARRRRIATVVFSHESLAALVDRFLKFNFLQKIVDWHNRRLSQSFDFVVASTEFAAHEFKKLNVANLRKIPLGVDLEVFQPMRREESIRTDLLQGSQLLLVHCGRLSIEKSPEVSLKVLRAMVDRGINARLVYVGMGPMFEKLKTASQGLPVTFLGYVLGPTKVASILAAADIALAPGPHETFCLAALEALACGTPVVASNKSALRELIFGDDGLTTGHVCGDQVEEWVLAIEKLISQPGLRQRCRARAEKYSWTKTVESLLEIERVNSAA